MSTGIENIVRLEELTRKFERGSIVYQLDDELDPVQVWTLWNTGKRVSVVRSVVPAGVTFPIHTHDETEFIICFDGLGTCTLINDGPSEMLHSLSPGKCIKILPGQKHRITAFKDLWVIAITIPASPGFGEING